MRVLHILAFLALVSFPAFAGDCDGTADVVFLVHFRDPQSIIYFNGYLPSITGATRRFTSKNLVKCKLHEFEISVHSPRYGNRAFVMPVWAGESYELTL